MRMIRRLSQNTFPADPFQWEITLAFETRSASIVKGSDSVFLSLLFRTSIFGYSALKIFSIAAAILSWRLLLWQCLKLLINLLLGQYDPVDALQMGKAITRYVPTRDWTEYFAFVKYGLVILKITIVQLITWELKWCNSKDGNVL